MNKSVSIIIPCRNEEKYISRCLDSIIHSNYDKTVLSVYVCDGMSDDATPNIIKQYAIQYSFIHFVLNTQKTTPFALNLGIKTSQADIMIVLGAHAEIASDYVEKCIKCFEIDNSIGCVGGVLENVYDNSSSESIGKAMSSSFGVGNAHFRTGNRNGFVDTVAFGAYKKEVFQKAGYFDEELIRNQDDEFNYRLIKNGYKIYLSDTISAKYHVRSSFSKLFKQYYQYGYWKVFVNKKHKSITTLRQIVPSLFVLFTVIGFLFTIAFPKVVLLPFSVVLIMYFTMAMISAIKQSSVLKIFPIVFSYLILHFSYGTGYLEGIWRFYFLAQNPSDRTTELTR